MAKKKSVKQYCVPMRWEYRGSAYVYASSAEEAEELARNLEGDSFEFDDATAELINWEVTGSARED